MKSLVRSIKISFRLLFFLLASDMIITFSHVCWNAEPHNKRWEVCFAFMALLRRTYLFGPSRIHLLRQRSNAFSIIRPPFALFCFARYAVLHFHDLWPNLYTRYATQKYGSMCFRRCRTGHLWNVQSKERNLFLFEDTSVHNHINCELSTRPFH